MKNRRIHSTIMLIVFILLSNTLNGNQSHKPKNLEEIYFKFQISHKSEIETVTKIVSIDNRIGNTIYAYALENQFENLKERGYDPEIIPKPAAEAKDLTMAYTLEEMANWDRYPTYDVYLEMMYQFAEDHPDICSLQHVGYSIEDREILFLKISDNVDVEEPEPEFMYTAQMHGDEIVTFIMMLQLASYLLNNYETDPEVTHLVNDAEIWINPLSNPDGTYHGSNNDISGAIRYNANFVDLNRNFPDPEDGPHPDGEEWQPENILMMELASENSFIHSANLHSGAEVLNYPWDTWNELHADDDWYIDISKAYADTVFANSSGNYFTGISQNGYIRGYVWYSINGGRQDYMNYFQGCREVTLELANQKLLDAEELPAHWQYNKRSLINYIKNIFFGVRGIVTDSLGNPADAKITVLDHDYDNSEVFTDMDVGDYYRMLLAGSYDLEFSGYGFEPQIVENVSVIDTGATVLNIILQNSTSYEVSGTVRISASQVPIQGAIVEILDAPVVPDTTDGSGFYSLGNIYEGTYTFKVSAEGYPSLVEEIEISENNHVIDFELSEPDHFFDFEQHNGGFVSNHSNGWQWGEPTAGEFGAYSGENVWGTVLAGNYSDNADWTLDSPEITLFANSILSFYHYHDFEQSNSMYDGGNVQISTDGGNNFVLITPTAGYSGEISALNEEGFGGTIQDWQEVSFDLSEYSGEDVSFRWHFASDGSVHDFFGWYIDDVNFYHLNKIDGANFSQNKISLMQNYPNPFDPTHSSTNIAFSLPQNVKNPELNIYNIKGQLVKNVACENGDYRNMTLDWNGENNFGKKVTSGIYFYEMRSDNFQSQIKKLIVIR